MKKTTVVFLNGNYIRIEHATENSVTNFLVMMHEAKEKKTWMKWASPTIDFFFDGAKVDGWYAAEMKEGLLDKLSKHLDTPDENEEWKKGS